LNFEQLAIWHKIICKKTDTNLTEPEFAALLGFDKSTFSNWKKRTNGAPAYAINSAEAHAMMSKTELLRIISQRLKI